MTLSLSRDELAKRGEGPPDERFEILMDMYEHACRFQSHLKAGLELAESAMARILIAAGVVAEEAPDMEVRDRIVGAGIDEGDRHAA